jgi:hypothetical protein
VGFPSWAFPNGLLQLSWNPSSGDAIRRIGDPSRRGFITELWRRKRYEGMTVLIKRVSTETERIRPPT